MTDISAVIRLTDYTPFPFVIHKVALRFELGEDSTDVISELSIQRKQEYRTKAPDLSLDGQDLELISIVLSGAPLPQERYELTDDGLVIFAVPETFTLTIHTRIDPKNNTALEGLYRSGTLFCTQCEAEGFRRMTYYPDRPDVLTVFTTTLVADKSRYPVLLSNGNPIAEGEEAQSHWMTWEDPFPKPCYLFALVAGNLVCQREHYITRSGKPVDLRIYVEEHNSDRCTHAMRSLVKAMRWDEETYGLEYDLDRYMIVAVDQFNMGAMENKGLNIFNSKYVLASPETATDTDFSNIESVIAHEYFHNWTGNRVTCRDWFQLSLKEGLTVFRDQEFSADMGSRALKRIGDVRVLRGAQFKEDAGPMAHPVRPSQYAEINNFYTLTVYNKGAEVIRMMHRLLGAENFRKGMDLYFVRHDGEAVTTDDFVQSMEDASGINLTQFRRWYVQAGTPTVRVNTLFEPAQERITLTLEQHCSPTADGSPKDPFHIPIETGFIDQQGAPIACAQAESATQARVSHTVELTQPKQSFVFTGIKTRPTVSVLRGFSSPVNIEIKRSLAELGHLAAHDIDMFNRWDALQELALRALDAFIADQAYTEQKQTAEYLLSSYRTLLTNPEIDQAFSAEALTLPSETYIADRYDPVNVEKIHAAREQLLSTIAQTLAI